MLTVIKLEIACNNFNYWFAINKFQTSHGKANVLRKNGREFANLIGMQSITAQNIWSN